MLGHIDRVSGYLYTIYGIGVLISVIACANLPNLEVREQMA